MNHSYSYKVFGFKKLVNNLNPFVERFYLYKKTLVSLKPLLGEHYFGSQSVLANQIKQIMDVYKHQLKFDSEKELKKER
jgi:hypothetical protein